MPTLAILGVSLAVGGLYIYRNIASAPDRRRKIPPTSERVLILGASSGIGKEIALQYAARGASLALVGRRDQELEFARAACVESRHNGLSEPRIVKIKADFTDAEDVLTILETLEREWTGVDTVIIAAGVTSIKPLLWNAGIHSVHKDKITLEGLRTVQDKSMQLVQGNFMGPLTAVVALIPFMSQTSLSPSILLISSVAAAVAAPTRALYAATKSASLLLFQSLSIENPQIKFSIILPGTVDGNFRRHAVDSDPKDVEIPEKRSGLSAAAVASACLASVDYGKRVVWIPFWYRFAHALYWIWPSLVEDGARKKYNFQATT